MPFPEWRTVRFGQRPPELHWEFDVVGLVGRACAAGIEEAAPKADPAVCEDACAGRKMSVLRFVSEILEDHGCFGVMIYLWAHLSSARVG